MVDVDSLQRRMQGMFLDLLGIRLVRVNPERVVAELDVRDELCTVPGLMHGGAVMAFADTLGAVGTVANLGEGQTTTTLESKTNFLGPARAGSTITGECAALHRGRQTMVWQTRITSGERNVAIVTKTQMVLDKR